MLASADRVRDQQRLLWDEFSAGWKKWDAELLGWHAPFGDALLQEPRLRPDSRVLDVAAGTGEPGLDAAALVPDGRVVLTDISEGMLRVARGEGSGPGPEQRGLRRSATPPPCRSTTAPSTPVICRFGFMFFPVMSAAMAEMVRAARPGARIGAAVWGRAAENPWASLILGTIARHPNCPYRPPERPGCSAAPRRAS